MLLLLRARTTPAIAPPAPPEAVPDADRTVLEWFPPVGDPVRFTSGRQAAYRLRSLDGIGPVPVTPVTTRGPGQSGETMLDAVLPARVVVVQGLLQATDQAALWDLREALSRALSLQPVPSGGQQRLGRLRLARVGQQEVELDAVPRSVSIPMPPGGVGIGALDAEFLAPYPFWRDIVDRSLTMQQAGGFEWDLEFPLEMPTANLELDVVNEGDVDAPVLIRFWGAMEDPVLHNDTTGQSLAVEGVIAGAGSGDDGEYVEVDTTFGAKRVDLVDASSGVRTNAMDRLDLSRADFWSLRPGVNRIRFEADSNPTGWAQVVWRPRWSGV